MRTMRTHTKHKASKRLIAQDDILSDSLDYTSGCDFVPQEGQPGFSKALATIKRLIEAGYDDIDIIIQLHEENPKDIANKALQHASIRGLL